MTANIKVKGRGNISVPEQPLPPRDRKLISFEDILYETAYCRHLSEEDIDMGKLASIEALNRLQDSGHFRNWSLTPSAFKEHECVRGCKIFEGELFFKYKFGEWHGDIAKHCLNCFSLILFHIPDLPHSWTHIDLDTCYTCQWSKEDEKKRWADYGVRRNAWDAKVAAIIAEHTTGKSKLPTTIE